jgi:hypothetical protein
MRKVASLLTAASLAAVAASALVPAAQAATSIHIVCRDLGGLHGTVNDMRVTARDCDYVEGANRVPIRNRGERDLSDVRFSTPPDIVPIRTWDCPTLKVRNTSAGWVAVGFDCHPGS